MKKNQNLFYLLESLILSGVLGLFLWFMRKDSDLFFFLTAVFSAIALLFLLIILYIDGDHAVRGICKLFPIARSDLVFGGLLCQFAFAAGFGAFHNLHSINLALPAVLYTLIPIVELIIILAPAPKDTPPPIPSNEGGEIGQKSLDYYAALLRNAIQKCEFESLNHTMEKTADLLARLDPIYSVQLQALENDISNKCVKIENALLTHNHTQLLLLERELTACIELIEKRCESYKYCLKDEGFYHTDDEIAMSQIDLLLDKLGLEYEEDLPTLDAPFDNEFFYQKALRFASDEYAALLASYNRQIVKKLEQQAQSRIARREKRLRRMQLTEQAVTFLIVAAMAGLMLFWHTTLQPDGLILSDNGDGTLSLVGYNSFYGDELSVPSSVKGKPITTIGKEALMGSDIQKLILAEGIEVIDYQSLKYCDKLETIVLPQSLTTIGNYVFKYDEALLHIYYRGSEEEWYEVQVGNLGNEAFTAINIEFDYQD